MNLRTIFFCDEGFSRATAEPSLGRDSGKLLAARSVCFSNMNIGAYGNMAVTW